MSPTLPQRHCRKTKPPNLGIIPAEDVPVCLGCISPVRDVLTRLEDGPVLCPASIRPANDVLKDLMELSGRRL
jgi:hypothetical protein